MSNEQFEQKQKVQVTTGKQHYNAPQIISREGLERVAAGCLKPNAPDEFGCTNGVTEPTTS